MPKGQHRSAAWPGVLAAAVLALAGCATVARHRLRGVELGRDSSIEPTVQAPGRSALPPLTAGSQIEDYLAYAALSNPGLKTAFERWQAALQRVPQAESLPDPKVSYAYFIRSVETRTGPMEQQIGLAQRFPFYGKRRLRGGKAAEAANAELERYEAAKMRLFYRVHDAYYELYYLKQALEAVNANLDLLQTLEQAVRTRYAAGAARNADLLRLHVELGKIANEKSSLEDLRQPLVARLNAALNRPPDTPLPWPPNSVKPPPDLDEGDLLQKLVEFSPEMGASAAEIEEAQLGLELAKKDYWPDFTLGLQFTEIGEARTAPAVAMSIPATGITIPAPDESTPPTEFTIPGRQMTMQMPRPKDSGKDAFTVMVSFNLPIWYGRLGAGVKEAQSKLRAAIQKKKEKENSLLAHLKLVLYKYRDAVRQIGLYRDTLIPRAEQSLRAVQASYMGGEASFADLVDAERLLLAFSLAYHRARADQLQRLAEAEMLVGVSLQSHPTQEPVVQEGGGSANQ